MTLDELRPGQHARILSIEGGHGLLRRLGHMGMNPGDTVQVASQGAFHGPCLVNVRGSRVAIGRGIARRIHVDAVHPDPRREVRR
jgi:ferrous iron transport protein A